MPAMAPVAAMIPVPLMPGMGIGCAVAMLMTVIGVHLVRGVLVPRVHGVRLDIILRQRICRPGLARRAGRHMSVMVSMFGMHAVMVVLLFHVRHNACRSVGVMMFVTHNCI